jgi:hypothetical protein
VSWPVFLTVSAALLAFALMVWLGGRADERRWKRERQAAERAAGRPAE